MKGIDKTAHRVSHCVHGVTKRANGDRTSVPAKDMNAYMRDRYHRLRSKAIAHLGGTCVHCGTTEGLQIDHIEPGDKSFKVDVTSHSWRKVLAELEKCQLLCAPCHLGKSRTDGCWTNRTRLTVEDVRDIRSIYDGGEVTQRDLAEVYGVNVGTIGNVVRGDTWAKVAS